MMKFKEDIVVKKPKQAANKAFSSIIKDLKKNDKKEGSVNVDINFSIKECTRNSKHKEYKYIGKRESLETPVKVEIKNSDGTVKECGVTLSDWQKKGNDKGSSVKKLPQDDEICKWASQVLGINS